MQEYSYSQKQLGTEVTISLVVSSEIEARKISQEAFAIIAKYEQQFSRFLPQSELSLLNSKKELVVSEEFIRVLKKSFDLYQATTKIFNPLLQISRLGYSKNFSELEQKEEKISRENYNTDFNSVTFDQTSRKVTLQNDQQLDFGGILKGYLAEKISKDISLKYPKCHGNIVNLGGDLHTEGRDENSEPFIFMIYNPVLEEEIPTALTDTSLATSGTYKRTWQTLSGTKNHILAPDGYSNPRSNIISASVICQDGATAEAWAKTFLISGKTDLPQFNQEEKYKYLLITKDGKTLTNII